MGERPELDYYCRVFQENGHDAPKGTVLSAFIAAWDAAAPGGAHTGASATIETYEGFRLMWL